MITGMFRTEWPWNQFWSNKSVLKRPVNSLCVTYQR